MNMEIDPSIYERLKAINWFVNCGAHPDGVSMPFASRWCNGLNEALSSIQSTDWQDLLNQARGDLTGYLASHHYDAYASHWNRLAKAATVKIQAEIMPALNDAALRFLGFVEPPAANFLFSYSLVMITMQSCYKRRFSKAPDFFIRILDIYERGYLPCGWDGDLADWPQGSYIIY